jgi:hypothetical protein
MRTLIFVGLLLTTAAAQSPVCASGVVRPVTGPTICMQGETHMLADTRLYLRSATIDLNRYNNQLVRIEGTDIGVTCRVVAVSAVYDAPAVLRHCGTPMPGCPIKLQVGPGALGRWALFASFGQGVLPLGCAPPGFWLDGTFFLAVPAETLSLGFFGGAWGEYTIPIPAIMSLAGMRLWFQGARQDIGPIGPVQFTNAEQITVVPFMPPCGGINC